ncbi:MAG: type II toxin-antitoxin system RelE/ParE family toxin [Zetaproteobacteria bacterium]|nr:type II toxin-antitoxin system RelE/ParE family toxin [Zetaproteobacteria bacterium]
MTIIKTTLIFDQWLKNLRDKIAIAKIKTRMDRLELGNAGDVKPVGEGVSEMRIHTGAGYRVYFIILLCGGDKSSQSKDIEKAKQLAKQL